MKISILGKGVFGKAVASHLIKKGHEVFFDDVKGSELIFICVSSHIFLNTVLEYKKDITDQKIIICTKGFASGEKLLSEALEENLKNDFFFLYGPTLANELEAGEISGMVLAGGKGKEEIKKEIESENLRIEVSDDMIGVQIGGALKNVITIFTGVAEGANYGQNAQAFIFTKGLEEIQKIGIALEAKENTFLGLSCVGDLTLYSRNRQFGIEIGKGKTVEEFIKENNYIPEGLNAIKDIKTIAKSRNIEINFINLLYGVMFENLEMEEAIKKII